MELVCTLIFTAALNRCGMSVEEVRKLYEETNYFAELVVQGYATLPELQWSLRKETGIQFDGRAYFGG